MVGLALAGGLLTSGEATPTPEVIATATTAADAAALPTGCTQAQPGADVVCTYTSVGEHTFVVPAGVTSVAVDLIGGVGGDASDDDPGIVKGGAAARVTGPVTVSPGSTLYAEVGGAGRPGDSDRPTGGENGGSNLGPGVGDGSASSGGGGASDVRTTPTTGAQTLASRLAVAGGGGGAAFGFAGHGGDAYVPGQGTPASPEGGGETATPTRPGAAADTSSGFVERQATSGQTGVGGDGVVVDVTDGGGGPSGYAGGGGGGGLYGGGGGSWDEESNDGFGGGGGSSLVPDGGTSTLTRAAPQVVIRYTPVPTTLAITARPDAITAGRSLGLSATVSSPDGAAYLPATDETTYTIAPDGTCDGVSCTAQTPGTHTITGTRGALQATTTVQVTAGTAARIRLSPDDVRNVRPREVVTFAVTAEDVVGNDLGEVTDDATFTVTTGGTCRANTCRATRAGLYTVTARYLVPATGPRPGLRQGPQAAIQAAPQVAAADQTISATATFRVGSLAATPPVGGAQDPGTGGAATGGAGSTATGSGGDDTAPASYPSAASSASSAASSASTPSGVLPAAGAGELGLPLLAGLVTALIGAATSWFARRPRC